MTILWDSGQHTINYVSIIFDYGMESLAHIYPFVPTNFLEMNVRDNRSYWRLRKGLQPNYFKGVLHKLYYFVNHFWSRFNFQ